MMKKKITPIIKSPTRVKSMFAFMHDDIKKMREEEHLDADINTVNVDNEIQKIQEVEKVEEQDIENVQNGIVNSGEPIILQRSRGDVTVDKTKNTDNVKIDKEPVYKSSKIVEIESKTYDGQPAVAEKMTFKAWWKNLSVKVVQGWDRFIQKKGAVRFLVLLGIMVLLIIALLIYTAVIRTDFRDLFESPARAFVMSEADESGVGTMQDFTLKDLARAEPHTSNTAGFQYIDFYAQNLDRNIDIESIYFGLYTEFTDLTLLVSMTISYGEDVYLTIEDQRTDLSQRVGRRVTLRINQSIAVNSNMHIHLEFKGYRTSEYINAPEVNGEKDTSGLSNYDVEFSIFDLQYIS